MTEDQAASEVYAVLLQQPTWYGVPMKLVLWTFTGMLGLMVLAVLLLPGAVLKIVGAMASGVVALGVLVLVRCSGQADPDLMEIVFRFVRYPRYLGPR